MKFYDAIGYAESVELEDDPGVYEDVIVERKLFGDVLRNTRGLDQGDQVNPSLKVGMRFSLIGDIYAEENFEAIRYIMWKGRRWLVSNIEFVERRLILTPGGLYNGPTPEAPPTSS